MEPGQASRTAVFVCQGRAVADGRLGVGRFADPVAELLLSATELSPVRLARNGEVPADGRERFSVQSVNACAEVIAPRTVVIDSAVSGALQRGGQWQIVLLGAGLDARPWRMAALRGIPVYSVDHPATQADLRRRAESLPHPVCDLRFVAADLAHEPLGALLSSAGFGTLVPTAWVWEGVIPYLSRARVTATLDALTSISAAGSMLIAQYQSRSLTAQLGRRAAGLVSRVAELLTDRGWAIDSDASPAGQRDAAWYPDQRRCEVARHRASGRRPPHGPSDRTAAASVVSTSRGAVFRR